MNNSEGNASVSAQVPICEHCGRPVTIGQPHIERNARNEIFFMGHVRCSATARRLLRALAFHGAPSFRSMRSARACLKKMGVKLNKPIPATGRAEHAGVMA